MELCKKVGGGEGECGTEDMSDHTCVYLHTQAMHSRETFLPKANQVCVDIGMIRNTYNS